MTSPREVISINVGKAGIGMGNSCWELYCEEQGILQDGSLSRDVDMATAWCTFFRETEDNRHIPRAVFTDLERRYIDFVKGGPLKDLLDQDQLLHGKYDAACLYARGYFTNGKDHLEPTMTAIRHQVEAADNPQGFISHHSLGGGTGSGFNSLLLERLTGDFPAVPLLEVSILPTPEVSPYFVEPYNIILATHTKLEYTNTCCSFLFDNKALQRICKNFLEIDIPDYPETNQLASHVISGITAGMRYPENRLLNIMGNHDINLTPFPKIHFPIVSYAPYTSVEQSDYEIPLTINDLTNSVFSPENNMVCCDATESKYIACSLLYRGKDMQVDDTNQAMEHLKDKMLTFKDWTSEDAKIAVHKQPLKTVVNSCVGNAKRAAVLLTNTPAIKRVWTDIGAKFDLLFSKRAYVHWFTEEGMELDEFDQARECVTGLIDDLEELEEMK